MDFKNLEKAARTYFRYRESEEELLQDLKNSSTISGVIRISPSAYPSDCRDIEFVGDGFEITFRKYMMEKDRKKEEKSGPSL